MLQQNLSVILMIKRWLRIKYLFVNSQVNNNNNNDSNNNKNFSHYLHYTFSQLVYINHLITK